MKYSNRKNVPTDLNKIMKTKEFQNAQKELSDQDASEKYIPTIHELFVNEPTLRPVLFDPLTIARILTDTQKQINVGSALSQQQSSQNEQLYGQVFQQLCPYVQIKALLGLLSQYLKRTKIKRNKKALNWAIADLLRVYETDKSSDQSYTIRAVVAASISYMNKIQRRVYEVLEDNPPRGFSYEQYCDVTFIQEELAHIIWELYQEGPDFLFTLSARALELFDKIQKPFGLRFHQILHYPNAFERKSNLIITPGQEQEPDHEDETEKQQRINQAVNRDYRMQSGITTTRQLINDIKSIADETLLNELTPALNAAVLSSLFPVEYNPFYFRLYQESGEKALEINPEDEKNLIIEIKSSPDQPTPYRQYAERLEEKGELNGAINAYLLTQEYLDEEDEHIANKINELTEKVQKGWKEIDSTHAEDEVKEENET